MKSLIQLCVCLVLIVSCTALYPDECGPCDRDLCRPALDCVAGTTLDRCGCCPECAKQEHEVCHHPEAPGSEDRGKCGEYMECLLSDDSSTNNDQPEALCFCRQRGEMCGSDDVTYGSLCHLSAAAMQQNTKITVKSKGHCPQAPTIISGPKSVKAYEGENVAIDCEAIGYPIPTIEWTWTRVDGKTVFLPGDDLHISVNMRGGPEKSQVTGWLQVMDMKKKHEGDYTCIVQNVHGVQQAPARVNVIQKDSKKSKYNNY